MYLLFVNLDTNNVLNIKDIKHSSHNHCFNKWWVHILCCVGKWCAKAATIYSGTYSQVEAKELEKKKKSIDPMTHISLMEKCNAFIRWKLPHTEEVAAFCQFVHMSVKHVKKEILY